MKQKKPWYQSWWMIVLYFFFGIIFLIALLSPNSPSKQTEKTEQIVEEVKESSEFIIPPERLFAKNLWIELRDYKYFIGEPETTYVIKQKYGEKLRSEDGQSKFVILPFKIENIGKETKSLWDVNINLITKDDIRYKPLTNAITIEGIGKTLLLEQLQPGLSKNGIIVYEIPREATIKMFELTEEFLPKEEKKYIDINYYGFT